jgi:hypothetical protein
MAGEVKLEILFRDAVYVFTGRECERMLGVLDAVPEIGTVTGTLREGLRKALYAKADAPVLPNPFPDESEEPPAPWLAPKDTLKNVAKENADACGDCRIPKCRFCDQPGTRAGGRKDGAGRTVERYYICNTEGCLAAKMKTPQPLALFSGGK